MTFEQIKELIDIVCRKGLRVLEIERSDLRVRIEGQGGSPSEGVATSAAAAQVSSSAEILAPASNLGQPEPATASEDGMHLIVSPIVGTFYAAPSPDSDPYVQVGDVVKSGQVLCIVEAMKLMNEIESDIDGEVVEIMGRNAQPVEYGEQLFAIRPS